MNKKNGNKPQSRKSARFNLRDALELCTDEELTAGLKQNRDRLMNGYEPTGFVGYRDTVVLTLTPDFDSWDKAEKAGIYAKLKLQGAAIRDIDARLADAAKLRAAYTREAEEEAAVKE